MPIQQTETPAALEFTIALRAQQARDALWREARGTRLHLSDALFGIAVALSVASAIADLSHAAASIALASMLALAGYSTRTTRQLKAMCLLLERFERAPIAPSAPNQGSEPA